MNIVIIVGVNRFIDDTEMSGPWNIILSKENCMNKILNSTFNFTNECNEDIVCALFKQWIGTVVVCDMAYL